MLVDIKVTLKFQEGSAPGAYAITKTVRGQRPLLGTRYMFNMPLEAEEGFVWLNGCIMGRVIDVLEVVERELVVGYHAELETLLMTFEEFQEVVKAPWLKRLGWKVTEASL